MCALHHRFCAVRLRTKRMPRPWDFRTFLTFFNPAACGAFASAKEIVGSVIDRVRPAFGHRMIDSPPHLPAHNRGIVVRYAGLGRRGVSRGICNGERSGSSKVRGRVCGDGAGRDDAKDKALWITLAQSWVRLAEHVARSTAAEDIVRRRRNAVAIRPGLSFKRKWLNRRARKRRRAARHCP